MTYCSAPFTSLQIKNDGTFSYCCMMTTPSGKHNNDTDMVKGRQKMINGEVLEECNTKCYGTQHLQSSHVSYMNKLFPISSDYKHSAEIDPKDVQYIDLRVGNICNYMCLMCGDEHSHLWAKAHNIASPYISWTDSPEKYNQIINFISKCVNLKSLSLAGGEPFYNKAQINDILDRLPREMDLKLITNVSTCSDDYVSVLNEFQTGRLNSSIDGVGRWNDTQRFLSEWDTVNINILKYAKQLHSKWDITLVPTFTVINILGVEDFFDWYVNTVLPVRPTLKFGYTICQQPRHMSMYIIPLAIRTELADRIQTKFGHLSVVNRLASALRQDVTVEKIFVDRLISQIEVEFPKIGMNVYNNIPELKDILSKK